MTIIELMKELQEAEQYAVYRKSTGGPECDIWEQIERLNRNLKNLTKLIIHKGN